MKIVVLGGGLSTERHVSLVSATSVCKGLRELGHKAIFVDMFLGLENYNGSLESAFDSEDGLCGKVSIEHEEPDLEAVKKSRKFKSESHLGKNVLEICSLADCVFLALHGKDGEDGKIQAALELLSIPFTGSDHVGSAIAMDKLIAKAIMRDAGIPTPPTTEHAPCVVKCATGGSSIGTYICETDEEMLSAILTAKKYKDKILVEKKIIGREFTVPILGNKALTPIEIIPPKSGKFDYISKYQSGDEAAREVCPPDLDVDKVNELKTLAENVFNALGLAVISRADFIMDNEGNFYCLEVNTLPGMTPASLVPKSAKLEGLDYPHLCEKIVEISLDKI